MDIDDKIIGFICLSAIAIAATVSGASFADQITTIIISGLLGAITGRQAK